MSGAPRVAGIQALQRTRSCSALRLGCSAQAVSSHERSVSSHRDCVGERLRAGQAVLSRLNVRPL
jgi:hypothetical protein